MSTKPHSDADKLRAIADGKQMQVEGLTSPWTDARADEALWAIAQGYPCRIKPETVMVNGVECHKPNTKAETNWVSIRCTDGRESVHCFDSVTDAIAVYEALIRPFEECQAHPVRDGRRPLHRVLGLGRLS